MPNELPLPEELKHLLEKRAGQDRRQSESESKKTQSGQSQKSPPKSERRKKGRRKGDASGRKK
jgi:hypothetical protein